MILDIIQIGAKLLDKIIPDPEQREKAKLELMKQDQAGNLKEIRSSMKVVLGEINGHSWLQRNWRPVTMLTFVGLIVAKWLGFTAPGVTEAIELQLLEIIKVGLGGYIVGRSVEKGIKEWKK